MKFFLSGAGGLIGRNLYEVLDRNSKSGRAVFHHTPESIQKSKNWEILIGDLRDVEFADQAVSGTDTVLHFAAKTGGIQYVLKNSEEVARDNGAMSKNLIQASEKYGATRFVYASSINIMKENPPGSITGGYGIEKESTAKLLEEKEKEGLLKPLILLLHNAFGPYDDPRKEGLQVITRFVRDALTKKTITIWGDGKQRRRFIFVRDLANAVVKLSETSYTGRVELAGPEELQISSVAETVRSILGNQIQIQYVATEPTGVPEQSRTALPWIKDWIPDFQFTPFKTALTETVTWISAQKLP